MILRQKLSVVHIRILTEMSRKRRTKRTEVPHIFIMHDNFLSTPDCSFMWGKIFRNLLMQSILPESPHQCYKIPDPSIMQHSH